MELAGNCDMLVSRNKYLLSSRHTTEAFYKKGNIENRRYEKNIDWKYAGDY